MDDATCRTRYRALARRVESRQRRHAAKETCDARVTACRDATGDPLRHADRRPKKEMKMKTQTASCTTGVLRADEPTLASQLDALLQHRLQLRQTYDLPSTEDDSEVQLSLDSESAASFIDLFAPHLLVGDRNAEQWYPDDWADSFFVGPSNEAREGTVRSELSFAVAIHLPRRDASIILQYLQTTKSSSPESFRKFLGAAAVA